MDIPKSMELEFFIGRQVSLGLKNVNNKIPDLQNPSTRY
jgi:hypothetical protein